MRHKLVTLILAVVVIVSLVIVGCAKPAPAPTPAPPAPSPAPAGPEEILIGADACLTGMYAGFGEGAVFGMKAAVEDINKQGGIYVKEYNRKLPVKLVVVDNESDLTKTGTLAEDLILRDKVKFLLTTGALEINFPIARVAERHKVPFMCGPGPFESWQAMRMEAEPPWRYSWDISFAIATPAPEGDFRHDASGYSMFDAWLGALKFFGGETNKKIALLAASDEDGTGWYMAFAPEAEKIGMGTYRSEEQFGLVPMDTTDFTSLIAKWRDENCELLWSNSPAPFFGAFWRQARMLGYQPKQVFATRAGLFYTDVTAWGGDLPQGICNEMFWNPSIKGTHGIGDTTPMSLHERWVEATGQPMHQIMGWLYADTQVLFDAIERAGSLDGEKVNEALGQTDMMTIYHRVVFDKDQYSRVPVSFGQWQKSDKPWVWDNPIVFSEHDFMPAEAEMIFPIPYD